MKPRNRFLATAGTLCAGGLLWLPQAAPAHGAPSGPARTAQRPTALPVESLCFRIDSFVFDVPPELPPAVQRHGASALPQDRFAFARAWLDPYRGHCIGRQGVGMLAKGVSQAILDRGYVTSRVLVPAQDLRTGTLRLAIIPGVIGELRAAGASRRGTWKTAFPARGGDLLRLGDLEQALEQMKRVPSQDVDMQVVPTATPGVSDIVIAVQQGRRWSIVAAIDDSGSRATGRRQGNLSLAIDNPLGINDLFNVGHAHDLQVGNRAGGTKGWNAFYSLPWGYWTAALSANGSDYFQQVAGVNQTFVFSGQSQSVDLKLQRVIGRTRDGVTGLQWRLSRRFGNSYIEDTEIAQQRRNNTIAEFGLTERHGFGAAQLDASLLYRQGVGGLGAQADALAAGGGPVWHFRMAAAGLALSMPFRLGAQPLRYVTAFRGQFTNDRLYFIDTFAIGSRHTVRGFDGENQLAGDSGFHWRNELQAPVADTRQALYAGLDYGAVFGPSTAALAGRQLAGAAVGLRGGRAFRFGSVSYDVFVGAPVYKPAALHTAGVAGGFQLVYQY